MYRELNEQLAVIKEKGRMYEKWNDRLEKLNQEEAEWKTKVQQRLEHLQKEQNDVDRLNSMTLSAFFYHLIGKKEDRLEKEELELMESKAEYDTASQMLTDIQEQRSRVQQELDGQRQYQFWQSDYKVLWGKKENDLLEKDAELQQMAEDREHLSGELQELNEADREGQYLLDALERAEKALSSAGNWGVYDMMGGGMISTHIKRSRMDDAQVAIMDAGRRLRRFQKELEDVKMAVNTELHLGGLLSFADYFFDNLFVDWMVQDKIRKAETQVKDGLSAVRSTMRVLKNQIREHKVMLELLERRYCEHIERAN
ncbi:hypothetical protein PTQ21_15375 [Paenibacillus marchantiae]|uniref:hypothetical protein n=1 Tax=Paenibacillus TaxID=44249 RepID=UPI000883FEA9|nr:MULTISPECIES: hypothetical protein [Paenibacillus]MCZ1266455.1 hypothetical protein [Paenibacillus tundrae]WDQ35519.1 hypothetical protein PTQ21_15375 [Paenibacillus marchantiae]SDJ88337.1 hypothetical protein SAMN05428961_10164 [Paenibacillus sp. OK060]SHN51631.1 hypothetical protein SAMN04487896_0066 [Paenibacillus sp. ov031]